MAAEGCLVGYGGETEGLQGIPRRRAREEFGRGGHPRPLNPQLAARTSPRAVLVDAVQWQIRAKVPKIPISTMVRN